MKRYDLYVLDSSKAITAAMPDCAWEISETLNIDDTLRAVLYEADKFSYVTAENTFIRLVNPEDSTDKRTYRLTSVEQSRIDGRHSIQCEGARIWADMGREIYEGWHPFKNIQVKTIVAELLGSSAFQIKSGGSAESDTTIIESLDFAYTTVLEGLQRVAELADLEIEIDESTSPESIDLKTRGSNSNVRFEYSINTSGIARRFRRAEVANKIYPVGGGSPPATCKGALFEVYSITTDTITVAGDKCIPSDDTYNTFKIKMVTGTEAGTSYTISDTTRGSSGDDDTIQLTATPSSVAAGDLFKFTDASGNDLDYVPDAASQATYGTFDDVVRDQQFQEIRTLITPGFMDGTYATGLHAGWTKTGTPTVAEETSIDYVQHGSASQHVTAASDTHGIYYAVNLDSSDYYSCAVNLYVVSGSVLVKITTTGSTGAVEYKNQGGTSGTGWIKVDLEGLPIEGASARLTIQATGGAAEFYVDAVSFTGTQQTRQFVRENGARELYRMAFDYLEEHDAPMVEYDLPNALDLYAIDKARYPFYDVSIGDTVTVIDPAMSLAASVRVLSLGFDSMGRQLRIKLSSHTSIMAAFSQIAPGVGRVVQQGRRIAQDETDSNRTNETASGIAERVTKIAGNAARASRYTGNMTATGQTSFDVGAGTLYVGTSLAYTIGAQTISGLSGGSVYYLYFDPSSASSGLQTTTTAATAYATNNIQLGVIKTGSTSNDNLQIYDTTGAQVSGEILTRGLEAYDTGGTKRIDIGVVQDPSASIGNPSDWGIAITNGMQQNTSLLAEYTGSIPGAVRYLYATFGDEDEDLTYDTTTQVLYGDFVSLFAKSSANMYLGLFNGEFVTGSTGHLFGHEISSLVNSGSGNVTALNIGVTQTSGGGHAHGLYVGDGLGVRSTSTGNAYGIYIAAVSSTSGSAYSIYDATTNRARFGGSVSIRGVDYVWPSSDGTANYVLSTDGSGNLSWVSNLTGSAVTGSGTTNYTPKWTSSSALGNSVIQDNGKDIGIGRTPSTWHSVKTALDIGAGGSVVANTSLSSGAISIINNAYFDSTDVRWEYIGTELATHYEQQSGNHIWYYAPSGTAGAAITFVEAMRINASGKVGLGTNSPAQTLDIIGTLAVSTSAQIGTTLTTGGNVTITSATPIFAIKSSSSGVNYSAIDFYENTSTHSAQIGFNNSTNLFAIGTIVSGNVSIATVNTTRWTFDTSGHFYPDAVTYNLGTTTKRIGDILIDENNAIQWYNSTTPKGYLYVASDDSMHIDTNGNHPFTIETSSVARIKVEGDGTVLVIGATSPDLVLERSSGTSTGNAGNLFFSKLNASSSQVYFASVVGSATDATAAAEDGRLQLYVFSGGSITEAIDIQGGTSTIQLNMNVDVFANMSPGSNDTYTLGSGSYQWQTAHVSDGIYLNVGTGSPTYSFENWSAAASHYQRIYSSGVNSSVGYAMQNDARTWFVYCNGSASDQYEWFSGSQLMYLTSAGALYNATGTYGTISDARLKTGVTDARDYSEDFKRLQFRKYRMIDDVSKMGESAPWMLGLVAQEVMGVFPGCVDTSNPTQYAVKSSVINTIGLQVTQNNTKRIEALEAEIEKLKAA